MADLVAVLFAVVRMWAANPEKVNIPKRSETLASWCLPFMSAAVRAAEKELDALALLESVKNLAARQAAKEKAKKE